MNDPTEGVRREAIAMQQAAVKAVNNDEEVVRRIREKYSDACNTHEFQKQYEAIGFMAPLVVVIRRSDGVKGSMEFLHDPRIYYRFVEES